MPSATLTAGDLAIINEAHAKRNPGIFTNYYMRKRDGFTVHPETPRYAPYMAHWKGLGCPDSFTVELCDIPYQVRPYETDGVIYFREERGLIPLPWHLEFYRNPAREKYIIGLAGTGKTFGIGALAMYTCATIPNFKFMGIAPTQFQSSQMVNSIKDVISDTPFVSKFLVMKGGKYVVTKPYYQIEFKNGSEALFMNVDKNADNIQSSYGDWYNLDEAGLLNDLDENGNEVLTNVALGISSRMRATAPDGRPRMGLMSWISNAYDCDTLWNRYEWALANPGQHSWGKLVTHKENPYLTETQLTDIRRNAELAGKEEQWMEGKRPPPPNAEISSKIIDPNLSEELFAKINKNSLGGVEGWHLDTTRGILFEIPFIRDHTYVITGDPGQGRAPDRNAPTIIVWDITDFPVKPAIMSAMWWGDGNGSWQPFVGRFERYIDQYHIPEQFRGYDSTAAQKMLAEFVFNADGKPVIPLGFDGQKKWAYLTALKLLLSKGLLRMPKFPKEVDAIRQQLTRYRIPDSKIPQDIVATLSMAAFIMQPLYTMAYPEMETADRILVGREAPTFGRNARPFYGRTTGARRSIKLLQK